MDTTGVYSGQSAPSREKYVVRQSDILIEVLNNLEKAIHDLEGALGSVLSPATNTDGGEKDSAASTVPLADKLFQANQRVRLLTQTVESISHRLEV